MISIAPNSDRKFQNILKKEPTFHRIRSPNGQNKHTRTHQSNVFEIAIKKSGKTNASLSFRWAKFGWCCQRWEHDCHLSTDSSIVLINSWIHKKHRELFRSIFERVLWKTICLSRSEWNKKWNSLCNLVELNEIQWIADPNEIGKWVERWCENYMYTFQIYVMNSTHTLSPLLTRKLIIEVSISIKLIRKNWRSTKSCFEPISIAKRLFVFWNIQFRTEWVTKTIVVFLLFSDIFCVIWWPVNRCVQQIVNWIAHKRSSACDCLWNPSNVILFFQWVALIRRREPEFETPLK